MKKALLVTFCLLLTACKIGSPATEVTLSSPAAGSTVTSPLTVRGEAPGTWFFERNIVAELQDVNGNILAVAGMAAQGEWMTTDMVPFEGQLAFVSSGNAGALVIRNDNPSGLPENDKSQSFPVSF